MGKSLILELEKISDLTTSPGCETVSLNHQVGHDQKGNFFPGNSVQSVMNKANNSNNLGTDVVNDVMSVKEPAASYSLKRDWLLTRSHKLT